MDKVNYIVLDCSAVANIDYTAANTLKDVSALAPLALFPDVASHLCLSKSAKILARFRSEGVEVAFAMVWRYERPCFAQKFLSRLRLHQSSFQAPSTSTSSRVQCSRATHLETSPALAQSLRLLSAEAGGKVVRSLKAHGLWDLIGEEWMIPTVHEASAWPAPLHRRDAAVAMPPSAGAGRQLLPPAPSGEVWAPSPRSTAWEPLRATGAELRPAAQARISDLQVSPSP